MLSEKQRQLVSFATGEGDISLSVGAIRSGKTFAATAGFFAYTQQQEERRAHLVLGRKLRVLESEVLPIMRNMASAWRLKTYYHTTRQEMHVGNQVYHVCAGNDVKSSDRIQGLTIHSGLIDEATLVPEEFWKTAVSRMTYSDSKLWGTCNPSYPLHWLKKSWIDEDRISQHIQFNFDDNPTLTDAVKQRNESMFSGVFYKRMVAGLWCAAEGLVYERYETGTVDEGERAVRTIVGVDYGTASTTAFVALTLLKKDRGKRYVVRGVKTHRANWDTPQMTDLEIADSLEMFCTEMTADAIVMDASAASLRAQLRKSRNFRKFTIRNASTWDMTVQGIRLVGKMLYHGEMVLEEGKCGDLEDELQSYSWDPDREDTPVKANDHCCDALRYATVDLAGRNAVNDTINLTRKF